MIVHTDAAMRIDLAGGTLDIYPLYLLEGFGITVNAAIDLSSSVRVASRRDGKVIVLSEDLNLLEQAPSLDRLEAAGPMELVIRVLRFFAPSGGVEVTTRNNVPKGSGLGASSALVIALSTALLRLTGARLSRAELIQRAANVEMQSIRVPTGKQDYYPAMYGGWQALWFDAAGVRRERLRLPSSLQAALQERLLLSFTGESRFSGSTNWRMQKQYIDGDRATMKKMRRIRDTAVEMREALAGGRLDRFGRLLGVEWQNRKDLAEGVTNARIEGMMAEARRAGSVASKLCGAGGGGCMITLAKPGRADSVASALRGAGATILNYRFRSSGVRIRTAGE
jgi:D-glycero-alpha-D-manno-heptose-7-phosphate kinase